jgi:prepilin-type N-terminal cleavage/methylation domain-containing protein
VNPVKLLRQRLLPENRNGNGNGNGNCHDTGFTLVEVMVSMFIFALIATGTAYTLLSALSVNRDSRARHVAVNLAAQEIDLARDAADLAALADLERPAQTIGTDTFHVRLATQWVATSGADDACGAGAQAFRYRRVNVTVTWDNQRPGSTPVRADTVITPDAHLNDPTRGSILIEVKGASGTGVSGVRVSAEPGSPSAGATSRESATTDRQGCAVLKGLTPGNYKVTASASGFIDSIEQSPEPTVPVIVGAGRSAGASFSYDRGMSLTASYASTVAADAAAHLPVLPVPARLYLPRDLQTTYLSSSGVATITELSVRDTNTVLSRAANLFPFGSGYQALAGKYVAPVAGGTRGCVSVDPQAWPAVTAGGVTRTGARVPAQGAGPGGSATIGVPMGVITLSGYTGTAPVTAVSATGATSTGDPGCAEAMDYTFGTIPGGSSIALPYGSWRLSVGAETVPASKVTVLSPGSAAGTTITLDPRQVTP